MRHSLLATGVFALGLIGAGCSGDDDTTDDGSDDAGSTDDDGGSDDGAADPDEAPLAEIDRFSADAGTLMVRDGENGLPDANEPIDFDQGPFVTQGLGPDGEVVRYYNFDIQPAEPAPIYAFFTASSGDPVADQLNVVGVIPGDDDYNDFWQVVQVMVPDDYVANSITSEAEVMSSGYEVGPTETLVNCPIVPDGSTATERLGDGDAGLVRGWYDGTIVKYFHFGERSDLALVGGAVPTSPIYVTFNINPDQTGGGPASGFVVEEGTEQTHNVVGALPSDPAYSPLWGVIAYDNADFESVSDLASAETASILVNGAGNVNCPLVAIE
jgi:hypothetical protein